MCTLLIKSLRFITSVLLSVWRASINLNAVRHLVAALALHLVLHGV